MKFTFLISSVFSLFPLSSSQLGLGSSDRGSYVVNEPNLTDTNPIVYHNQNVMSQGVSVFLIFYGNHSQTTKSVVSNFISGLGHSDWWTVTTEYYGTNGKVNNNITLGGTYVDPYSKGKSLSSSFFRADVENIVNAAIKAANWPKDTQNSIYALLLDQYTTESSRQGNLCTDYCGYHNTFSNGMKYAVIGDGYRCPGTLPPPGAAKGTPGCMQSYYRNQTDVTYSINNDQHSDSIVNVLAHEITETVTNYASAWHDSKGQENGDKCARNYIKVQGIGASDPYNGAYNLDFGSFGKYLIQSNWSPISQTCLLKSTKA